MKTWSIVAADPEDERDEVLAKSPDEAAQYVREALEKGYTLITITRES